MRDNDLSFQGDISYSVELQRFIFISKRGDLLVIGIDKEHLIDVINGESAPVNIDIKIKDLLLSRKEILIALVAQGLYGVRLRKCCREFEQYQANLRNAPINGS